MIKTFRRSLNNLGRLLISIIFCLGWAIEGLPAQPVIAAKNNATTIEVNTTTDEFNIDGDCSLREAIRAANLDSQVDACQAGSGADVIILPVGIFTLTIPGSGEDQGLTGDLDILTTIQIMGISSADTIIDGNLLDRIFEIFGSATLHISNLTLRNGTVLSGIRGGGAILNNSGAILEINLVALLNNHTELTGGAIDNAGTAWLNNITLDGNTSTIVGAGGAIFNDGTIIIQNSTFSNNASDIYGGGLDNSSMATLTNVTLSGNASAQGGGLFNDGDIGLFSVTFADNNTAIHNQDQSTLRIKNSVVANSTSSANCEGSNGTSEGHNIDSGNTCGFTGFHDLQNTDPQLNLLADNNGPTLTHALLAGSPAIDNGETSIDCPATDQRGAIRPADGDGDGLFLCDVGAFEYLGAFPFYVYLPFTAK
jgi:CSLREA domain-containing protein